MQGIGAVAGGGGGVVLVLEAAVVRRRRRRLRWRRLRRDQTLTDGEDLALGRLLCGLGGEGDAGGRLGGGLRQLHEHAVLQRLEVADDRRAALEDAEHLARGDEGVLVAAVVDLLAHVLAEQDQVALLARVGYHLPCLRVRRARPRQHHRAFARLLR